MLRSDLCDYSDAYIVVKGIINLKASENTDLGQKDVAFKNNAPIRSCITKVELKLRCSKDCVLYVGSTDNANSNMMIMVLFLPLKTH